MVVIDYLWNTQLVDDNGNLKHILIGFTIGSAQDRTAILSTKHLSENLPAILDIYRLQRSCGKVMFSQASVILFTGGVSGRHPPGQTPPGRHSLGRHTPVQTPPVQASSWADIPPGRHPSQQAATAADGTHPIGMHSCFKCFWNHAINQ